MSKSCLLMILFFISLYSLAFSQRIEKPGDLNLSDFSISSSSIDVLYQRTLITFLFDEDKSQAKVTDQQFRLSIESIIRIRLTRSSRNYNFVLFPNVFESDPKLKSIQYYYIDKGKIQNNKLKNIDALLAKNDSAHYINFKDIIHDSISIIELHFSLITQKKGEISIFNNKDVHYSNEKITINIPEIYTYKNLQVNDCFGLDIQNMQGSVRGYYDVNLPNANVIGKILADIFQKDYRGSTYRPVYFRINSFVYTLTDECKNNMSINYSPVLDLSLMSVASIL